LNIHKNILSVLFLALFLAAGSSCTTVRIGMELLMRDFDGNALIENEGRVRVSLETLLLTPGNYRMTGYTRQVFSTELKRTPTLYHSFYVVSSSETAFFTLSFAGTKKRFYSEGAWAINTEPDIKSYISYKFGANEWDVQEIRVNRGINTELTIKKVLDRIVNNINYYYNDHKNAKNGVENCNTAVLNTLVEND